MVNWSNVFNVKDYDSDYDKAAADAAKSGGGVVYYPAGTYKLSKSITLVSNVVIRGEPIYTPAKSGTKPGKLEPKTVFQCPDKEHLGFFNNDKDATNLGIINIDSDGCAVMLWPNLSPAKVSMKDYWYEATKVEGSGSNKVVVGNRIRNVVLGNPDPSMADWSLSNGLNTTYGLGASDPWPWRFSTAIGVYTASNALIGNNLLDKASRSAKTSVAGFKNIEFPYDNRYGIDVNSILYGGVLGKTSGGPCKASASNSPYFFARGVVVRDNYIYQNGRVGLSWSGGDDGKTPGSGAVIYNNHVEGAQKSTCYTIDGSKPATGHDTNENRGYNQGGYGSNVTSNTGHIWRQKTPDGYETVDGEGILHQCSANSDSYRSYWHSNDLTGSESGPIWFYKLDNTIDNVVTDNKSPHFVGALFNDGQKHSGNKCEGNSPKCLGIPP
eukprot:TRINITY_DN11069_c0_g1_i3.p1 TRINITY_DN11069_c0_g1~~TRINITY_DN11069_c0_g1_i3.p1  ORF type:complete len:490 (+),score=98.81 TRINITY_DN11069_c0_g1_i3:154-1470(+)